ncbi:MAG TPA: PHB depolymerase family esterase, partial [Beijerinckiaceae bacterium]|nr:PHB depolymerase family esterase [Beijerinckiaceae bacterium]
GLIVAYPAQDRAANPSLCWNWFDRKDQQRGSGEPAKIAGLTQELIAEFGIDRDHVFVAGLSAGGAMAAILAATYSDLYAAVGIHSGLPVASASDLISALAAMRGERAAPRPAPMIHTRVRTIVFHGDADQTVHPSNGERIVDATKSEWNEKGEETLTARSPGGSCYRRTIVRNTAGLPVLEHWTVQGMGHAWSGGSPAGSYTDTRGPDASREMVRFFLE